MKKLFGRILVASLLVIMWAVLSAADGGCYSTHSACGQLDEQACVSDAACQAIYGYPDEWYLEDGFGAPRCESGTRCIIEPNQFIECLDHNANPCAGLDELECNRRPICEPEFVEVDCKQEPGFAACAPVYNSCQLREERVWMSASPIQCQATGWESDRAANPDRYSECLCVETGDLYCDHDDIELCSVGVFLEHRGVVPHDLIKTRWDFPVCAACDVCERGYTISILVAADQVEDAMQAGFFGQLD